MLVLKQPKQALHLLEQQLRLAQELKERNEEKNAWKKLGDAYSSLHEPELALNAHQQAISLARSMKDHQTESTSLWSSAIQHAELGRRDEALTLGQQAIALLEQRSHPIAKVLSEHLEKYRQDNTEPLASSPKPDYDPLAGDLDGSSFSFDASSMPQPGHPAQPPQGPGWLRMALSAAAAAGKYLASGLKTVPADVHQNRLETCSTCQYHTGVRCQVCACFTQVKARLPHESCPVGKWTQ